MADKIYCKGCRYYHDIGFCKECHSEIGTMYVDTPYSKVVKYKCPDVINKNNDCEYYAPKESLRRKASKLVEKALYRWRGFWNAYGEEK